MRHQDPTLLTSCYQGWGIYHARLARSVAALSPEHLALRAAPTLRPVWELAAHIVAARAVWFHLALGEGDPALARFARWDVAGASPRTAAELVDGLDATWQLLHACLGRWTARTFGDTFATRRGRPITRGMVLWHVLEHDLHHGGELSLTLGMHGLPAVDL